MKIKEIKIKFKWRVYCSLFCSLLLIALLTSWWIINFEITTLTTFIMIIIMIIAVLLPLSKEADYENVKNEKFKTSLLNKIKDLKKLLEIHKIKEAVWLTQLLCGRNNRTVNENEERILDFFAEKYHYPIEECRKQYLKLFWYTTTQKPENFIEILKMLFLNREKSTENEEMIIVLFELFHKNKKNIFLKNEKTQKLVKQISKKKQFDEETKLLIEEKINFFNKRIKYIESFRVFCNNFHFSTIESKNKIFIMTLLNWQKKIYENCLYNYLAINNDNKSNIQILKTYIKEYENWKNQYYSLSHIQKNALLNKVKNEFLRYYYAIMINFVLLFEKIYKKKINGLPKNWFEINPEESKLVSLILKEEHPKVLKELFNFNDRSGYLWDFANVDLKHIIRWTIFAVKVNWCMGVLKKIVKNVNFNENTRQEILKNMYLFQKDRIHEFEDFLNMLLFQEDNKLEIENLTNNLITKNQKDNQTTS